MRNGLRIRIAYLVSGAALSACAGAGYRYYALEMPAECYDRGKLLASAPEGDKALSVCAPDETNRMKCVIQLTPEYERLRSDLVSCQRDLETCERGCRK
ncbi:MAG TPA: hypothetical protein VMZ26_13395 [Pyrinomonadaceae bacterium]|nr:hypothetical protein [Pyrinomonadaceae bacterium]